MNPSRAFNSGFSYGGSGACTGGWKNAKFMKAPYIEATGNSIKAQVVGDAINHDACIYQSTRDTCNFVSGGDGLTQLEYDYIYTGDANNNWSSFWLNAMADGRWIKDAEADPTEYMWGRLAHNWAGEPT